MLIPNLLIFCAKTLSTYSMDPKLSIKGSGYTRFQNRFTLVTTSLELITCTSSPPTWGEGTGQTSIPATWTANWPALTIYLPCI